MMTKRTHNPRTGTGRTARPHAAFSLIELLVVISIIALLVGLVIVAADKMRESAKVSQTRAMLGGLGGAAAEYEVATGLPIDHRSTTGVFDWDETKLQNAPGASGSAVIVGHGDNGDDKTANLYSERFVWSALKHDATAGAVHRVGEEGLVDADGDGFLELRDPWGRSIAYAAYNTHPTDGFLPESTSPFFASAGPDGKWGSPRSRSEFSNNSGWEGYLGTSGYADSRDNLYSFDIDRSAAVIGK